MKKRQGFFLSLLIAATALLGACNTMDDPSRVRVETDQYKFEYKDKTAPASNGSYDFCPPGQAKKGNC